MEAHQNNVKRQTLFELRTDANSTTDVECQGKSRNAVSVKIRRRKRVEPHSQSKLKEAKTEMIAFEAIGTIPYGGEN